MSQADDKHFDDYGDDADRDYMDDDAYCWRCENTGMIMICIDDMCRGAGECMHGDGHIVCPECKGESGL